MTEISSRCYFLIAVLLVLAVCMPVAAARHIIVMYDVSGSMIKLRIGNRLDTYMESEDIDRVNTYLTGVLFTGAAQILTDAADTYTKACDPGHAGKPLYQRGDTLTYAQYADKRYPKLLRQRGVNRTEFYRRLPRLKRDFFGLDSDLERAEVEVYDELYSEKDDETYWVFVTDGDVDRSGKNKEDRGPLLKRLAQIEEEYYSPMILGILVNNHVRVEVRRTQKRQSIDEIFIVKQTASNQRGIDDIQFSKNEDGDFISETLIVKTENSGKDKFQLDRATVSVYDASDRPRPVAVEPVPLERMSPPHAFRIPIPADPALTHPGNRLKLEIVYTYDGAEKTYTAPLLSYTAVIDSIYIPDPDTADESLKSLILTLVKGTQDTEDMYVSDPHTVRTESRNTRGFEIENIDAHIQDENGLTLCDVTVPNPPKRLGQLFRLEVPKTKGLNRYRNKLMVKIDYLYEGNAKSTMIDVPFKLQGSAFPVWIIPFILLLIVVFVGGIWLINRKNGGGAGKILHQIQLTQTDAAGMPLAGRIVKFITLTGKAGDYDFKDFWVDGKPFNDSPGLRWDKKGDIRFFEKLNPTGALLGKSKKLALKGDKNTVYIDFKKI